MLSGNSNSGQSSANRDRVIEYFNKGFSNEIIIGLTGLSPGRVSQIIGEYKLSEEYKEFRNEINKQATSINSDINIDNADRIDIQDISEINSVKTLETLDLKVATINDVSTALSNAKKDISNRLDYLQKSYDSMDDQYNSIEQQLIKKIKAKLEFDIDDLSIDKLLAAVKVISSIERRGLKFARERVINAAIDSNPEGALGALTGNGVNAGLVAITLPTHIVNNFMTAPEVKLDSTNRVIEVDGKSLITMDSNTLMENTVSELPDSIIPDNVKQMSNNPMNNVNRLTKEDSEGNTVDINHNEVIKNAARHVMSGDRYAKAFIKEQTKEERIAADNL